MSATVRTMTGFNDGAGLELYAAGDFEFAGATKVPRLAKWDGTAWTAPQGRDLDIDFMPAHPSIYDLAVHNDGSGPALFAAGEFQVLGSLISVNFARYSCDGLFFDGFESGDTSAWN